MHTEKQILIEKLYVLQSQLSNLVCDLEVERDCSEAINRIRAMNGLLHSIKIRIIQNQLAQNLAQMQANPSDELPEERRNQLVELFEALCKGPVHYQPTIDKVKHAKEY